MRTESKPSAVVCPDGSAGAPSVVARQRHTRLCIETPANEEYLGSEYLAPGTGLGCCDAKNQVNQAMEQAVGTKHQIASIGVVRAHAWRLIMHRELPWAPVIPGPKANFTRLLLLRNRAHASLPN